MISQYDRLFGSYDAVAVNSNMGAQNNITSEKLHGAVHADVLTKPNTPHGEFFLTV